MGIYNLGGGGGAPELQAKEATPLITNAQQIILPDEGYDGLSKVTVNPMPTGALKTPTVNSIGYVSSGVQTAGYLDTSATSGLQLSTQAAKTITPTTYSQTAVASGKYTTGAVTVAGDSDLVASNIKSGVNIFGVTGSYAGSPAIRATSNRASGQGSSTAAIFYWNNSLSSYSSMYKLISFMIEVNALQAVPTNGVTNMKWMAYAIPSMQGGSIDPIPFGVDTTTFIYYNVIGDNVSGSNCSITIYPDQVQIRISSVSNYFFDGGNSYTMHTWFAENTKQA